MKNVLRKSGPTWLALTSLCRRLSREAELTWREGGEVEREREGEGGRE